MCRIGRKVNLYTPSREECCGVDCWTLKLHMCSMFIDIKKNREALFSLLFKLLVLRLWGGRLVPYLTRNGIGGSWWQNGLQANSSSLRNGASEIHSLALHPSSVAYSFFFFFHFGVRWSGHLLHLDSTFCSQHAALIIIYTSWQPEADSDLVFVHIHTWVCSGEVMGSQDRLVDRAQIEASLASLCMFPGAIREERD